MSLLNNKYLFVHINKSGGSLVTNNFRNGLNGYITLEGAHRTLYDMLLDAKSKNINIDDLYTFTIVRNPWKRMLSMYLFYKNDHYISEFFSGNNDIDNDFNKWIEFIYSDQFDRKKIHSGVNIFKHCFCNQLNWLKNNNGELMKINKILRLENMNEIDDFMINTVKLNEYKNINIHPTAHSHYSMYYNKKSIDLVKQHYQEDIDYFSYKFEHPEIKSPFK